MTAKGKSCVVTIEIDPQGAEGVFTSEAMRTTLEAKAADFAEQKTQSAALHLHGPMPRNGLFGYRVKKGRKTWMAVIHPNNQAAYNIGRKYGIKNL